MLHAFLLPPTFIQSSRSEINANGDEDESDDDISLISRSPSPTRDPTSMDVDKYDEYLKGSVREVITVETKLKSSNKGFAMLANMGWVEGQPLGLSSEGQSFVWILFYCKLNSKSHQGRVDPIPFYVKNDLTGLGKSSQDVRMSQFPMENSPVCSGFLIMFYSRDDSLAA